MTRGDSTSLPEIHAFGHWLSGFTDGEGNFHLTRYGKRLVHGRSRGFQAFFRIHLRDDDRAIVEAIRDYLGCGRVYVSVPTHGHPNDNPQVKYQVSNIPDLMNVVIPHFLRFPLRAKKAKDFAIWREAVEYIHGVQGRPAFGCDSRFGSIRWTEADASHVESLMQQMKAVRKYTSPPAAGVLLASSAASAATSPAAG